ncbi:MAG: TIGR04282 family arsenosugar biosynthesis glycosyltransferase [Myxococcota bacterium]
MDLTAVVVMTKAPVLGAAKTRLAPVLTPAERLALHRALLLDRLDQLALLPGVEPFVAFTPAESVAEVQALVGDRARLVPQRGENLGERLANVAASLLEAGHRGVLLVDCDTPTLPPAFLAEAARALEEVDVVLGPAWDGGYYLIGLRAPRPELFEGIAWSTATVLAETVRRARALGLTLHFLPSWFDVDVPADLDRLARSLRHAPRALPGHPVRTAPLVSRFGGPDDARRDERWRTLASRLCYQNPWLRVEENVVDVGGGALTLYGVVSTGPCVGVLPLVASDQVLLVRQFRYVARRDTWEIPTGGVHAGESLDGAAHRELREETGFDARRLVPLSSFHTSKSVLHEVAHLYLGDDLFRAPAIADETEAFELRAFPIGEAMAMVESGAIVDAMSVIALLTGARRRGW